MSDYHETALNRHLEQLDLQARLEKHNEDNPSYYWHIVTEKDWDDYAYSEEEAKELCNEAIRHGLKYSCTKHVEEESYV
jgi:hypothetical protein